MTKQSRIKLNVYKTKEGKFYVSDPYMIVHLFDDGQLHYGEGTKAWDCYFNTQAEAQEAKQNYEENRA